MNMNNTTYNINIHLLLNGMMHCAKSDGKNGI